MSGQTQNNPRYIFIDALRGIAALGVVVYHVHKGNVLERPLKDTLPDFVVGILNLGGHGVEIFFVISGFVIAHSVRKLIYSNNAIGNFILRRQLRLDPPLWIAMCLAVFLRAVEANMPALVTPEMTPYTASDWFLNMFYLQNIFEVPRIVGVSWTLCLEVQFYLVFILLLKACTRSSKTDQPGKSHSVTIRVFALTGLLSLAYFVATENNQSRLDDPWFISFWYYFAGGTVAYWSFVSRTHGAWVIAYALTVMGACVYLQSRGFHDYGLYVGGVTLLAIHGVGRAGKLTHWLGNRVLQFLGRISYSLYLIHFYVTFNVMRIGYKVTGDNGLAAIGWFFVALLLSIGVSYVFYRLVEKPSMRLAARFKPRPVDEQRVREAGPAPQTKPQVSGS